MTAPELMMPEYVNLKNYLNINKRWLQKCLIDHPESLDLMANLKHETANAVRPAFSPI